MAQKQESCFNHRKQLGNCVHHLKQSDTDRVLSCSDTSEQQLETLIRQSFVDEKPVDKTNNFGSACSFKMLWEELAGGVLLTDLILTASVQIIYICFPHLKADVEIVHPQRYYAAIHHIKDDESVLICL